MAIMLSFAIYVAAWIHICQAHLHCGTDSIEHNTVSKNMKMKPIQHHPTLEGRAQNPDSSGVYSNIRIHVDTSQLEQDWADFNKLTFYLVDVIPAAYEWIQKVFKVRPVDGPLTFDMCNADKGTVWPTGQNAGKCRQLDSTWQQCGNSGATIPEFMFDAEEICTTRDACDTTTHTQGAGLEDTDLVIYYTGNPALDDTSRCKDVMGFATYCHSNSRDRPIAGAINLCRPTIENYAITWEEAITVIIHETFHVLGFIDGAFDHFRYENDTLRDDVYRVITKRGSPRAVITLPTVVEKARSFFDCSSMDGIELEDLNAQSGSTLDGELASHWDLRILINDVMVSYPPGSPVFGMFTLALFADSGWYDVNWDYAQEAPFGRGAGCAWYNNKCINTKGNVINDIFCTEEVVESCNVAQVGISRCTLDTYETALPSEQQYFGDAYLGGSDAFSDFCPIFKPLKNGECRLWGDNNNGTIPPYIDELGGLISGTSKCATVHGEGNGEQHICYPMHCIRDDAGEYVATRISHYRNYKLTLFDVITCWSDEDGDTKDFGFVYEPGFNYGIKSIYCPVFEHICYDRNPWMCNGHGTMVDGACKCSPGYYGRDCTIEYTKANRLEYGDTDSVSVYENKTCTSYTDDDSNVGVLDVDITGIDMSIYVEQYFKDALQHLVAILTNIPACDVEIREYSHDVLDDTRVTAFVYYYTSLVSWDEVSESEIESVFNKLFGSVSYSGFSVSEHKEAEGEHEDNVDVAAGREWWMMLCVVSLNILFLMYAL